MLTHLMLLLAVLHDSYSDDYTYTSICILGVRGSGEGSWFSHG